VVRVDEEIPVAANGKQKEEVEAQAAPLECPYNPQDPMNENPKQETIAAVKGSGDKAKEVEYPASDHDKRMCKKPEDTQKEIMNMCAHSKERLSRPDGKLPD